MPTSRLSSPASVARLAHMQHELDVLRRDIANTVSDDVRAVLEESVAPRVAALWLRGSAFHH